MPAMSADPLGSDAPGHDGAVSHPRTDDHGADHGHDDHAPAETDLGPIDTAAAAAGRSGTTGKWLQGSDPVNVVVPAQDCRCALDAHAGIDIVLLQFDQAAVRRLVVFYENIVPDLEPFAAGAAGPAAGVIGPACAIGSTSPIFAVPESALGVAGGVGVLATTAGGGSTSVSVLPLPPQPTHPVPTVAATRGGELVRARPLPTPPTPPPASPYPPARWMGCSPPPTSPPAAPPGRRRS